MANAMLGPIPPRRTTRSSTRKLRDTRCSCSATSCSANRPGKCIRWSEAMLPLTATGTIAHPTGERIGSVEGVAAGAGPGGVRVVDGEALLLDRVDEVDGGALHIGGAHPVDGHPQPVEVAEQVAIERALVEEQLVTQAGAATGLDGDAQVHVVAALLVEQRLGLGLGVVRELDAMGGDLGLLCGGRRSPPRLPSPPPPPRSLPLFFLVA